MALLAVTVVVGGDLVVAFVVDWSSVAGLVELVASGSALVAG